jgi:transcriptional regulator with XRE-family HTH domain
MTIDELSTDDVALAELGRRVERARLDRNLTQQQLAARAGVGKATLERLEAGRPSKLSTLVRVMRALGLSDRLEALLPAVGPSPLDLAANGRERQRARARRAKPEEPSAEGARRRRPWGDEL